MYRTLSWSYYDLFNVQSQLQHIYKRQPLARVNLNSLLESTLSPSHGLKIWSLLLGSKHCVLVILTGKFNKYPPKERTLIKTCKGQKDLKHNTIKSFG